MKKFSSILLTLSLILSLVGCTIPSDVSKITSSTISQATSSNTSISESSKEVQKETSTPDNKETNAPAVPITGNMKVHFLDVGQGDSIFIELPNKETMLIDAGNNADGNGVVSYIKNKGYKSITYLVASHPHSDHIGGMTTVVQGLNIKAIYMPKATHTTKTYEDLLTTIQNKGLKIKTAKAGVSIINSSDLKLDIVAPNSDSYENLNDYSAVLKLSYKEKSFLFTGDAETISLNEIKSNIKADVLKVGHHGSSTSTSYTFLSKVSPKYAVISVEKGNSYGHPTDATLNKLKSASIQVYRTDEVGTVIVTTDGSKITVDKKASTIKEKENAPPKPAPPSSTITSSTGGKDYDDTPITSQGYIGNINTKKFHLPSCSYLPATDNQVVLKSREEAISKSYNPCGRCHP